MYAFRFYAHKNDPDKSSSSLKEYFKRTADLPQDADAAAHIKIMRDLKSDPEFGPDLMSPFGYSNDSVRPQQVQLDENTAVVADYMNEEHRQSFADYSGKTKGIVDMYRAPHKGISVLGINDPRYSIYDPMSLANDTDTYMSQEDYQKRAADLLMSNESLRDISDLHDLIDFDMYRKRNKLNYTQSEDALARLYGSSIASMHDKAVKSGKNKYDRYFNTKYLMLPEHASKEESPFYDISAFLKQLCWYANTTSKNRPDNDFADSNLWLVKVNLDDMYSNDDRRKHFLHTGADDMHEFLAKKVTPYRYIDTGKNLKDSVARFTDDSSYYTAHNLKEANEAAADFMHKNFKVDPDEVWSDANLKDVYYDCSEPIYQAYYTTKLKPSVLAGAKGHFE